MISKKTESFNLINDLEFVVFDLETTGGNHNNDKIIEIGLVKIVNLKIVEKKDFLVQPEIPVPIFIQKLTSISTRDLKDAPIIEEIIDEILDFMGDAILVAHNTSFDVPFFNSVLRNLGLEELENKTICTNLMTKNLIPGLMNSNLNYMCEVFDIDHGRAHRALDDTIATARLLIIYLESFIEREITKINHLYYPRNRFELARLNFKFQSDNDSKDKKQELNIHILEKIKSLKTFSLITLKGQNGIILFSIIIKSSVTDIALIKDVLENFDWKTITVKLTGAIIDSYIEYSPLFKKMPREQQETAITHIWKEHLHEDIKRSVIETPLDFQKSLLPLDFHDFIISNNLVQNQYSIYPSRFIDKRFKLVFRFPIHQKKLLQYMRTKNNKLKNQKTSSFMQPDALDLFIQKYLKTCQINKSEISFINYNDVIKNEKNFLGNLKDFLSKYPKTYNYPKEHI